jgi:hypothetical protein
MGEGVMAHIPLRHGLHNQIHKNKTPPI